MPEPRRHNNTPREPVRRFDEPILARAAEINEAVASEFAEGAVSPMANALLVLMAELGVETEAAVSVALQRAHRIAFYMRHGRASQEGEEISSEARELSAADRDQVAALAVAWWDGVLTVLRACELERRDRTS